jgi:dipeptidyl aminopeptidase/acylaminoacyl peptidase
MHHRISRIALIVFMGSMALAAFGQKRPITETDLFNFVWIGDIQLSPSGKTLAFVETTVSPNKTGYETSVYLLDVSVPGKQPIRLTSGPHDSSPRWSPDGQHLAFVRSSEKDGKTTAPQLYLTTTDPKASVIRLTDLPNGVSTPQWAPNGNFLTVLSSTPQSQVTLQADAPRVHAEGDNAHVSDVRIINRALYRVNGEGYLDPTMVPQLYLISLAKPDGTQHAAVQLTRGRFGVQEYVWHPDSRWVLYTSTHEEEPYYDAVDHNSLFATEVATSVEALGQLKNLSQEIKVTDFTLQADGLSLSPDGNHLAFHAQQFPLDTAHAASYQESDLFVLDLQWNKGPSVSRAERNLTAGKGYEMGGAGIIGDNVAPRGGRRPSVIWSPDGRQLLDLAGNRGSVLLMSISTADGSLKTLSARKQAVLNFVATPDAKSIVALISNPIVIGDLFKINPDEAPDERSDTGLSIRNQTQLTRVNDALFSQLDLQMPEELQVTPKTNPQDIAGQTIDTFVQLPPHFDRAKKYPAILNIHGGPHVAYGWIFDHEILWMAAKGYVTIYPNPRGSISYGQNFANIIMNKYPGDDFHDLMDTVDMVIAKGWADPNKLAVTGGSGGGLLTNWIVTKNDRFKAAVSQRDGADLANWWYTGDQVEFRQFWWPGAPFASESNLAIYKQLSPLTYVNNVKTPMMFVLGDMDYSAPPTAGGETFFRALKYKKVPTVMVRFPREGHELSRSGEPWHRVERLQNIVGWFDKWLMGACKPQYDIVPECAVSEK